MGFERTSESAERYLIYSFWYFVLTSFLQSATSILYLIRRLFHTFFLLLNREFPNYIMNTSLPEMLHYLNTPDNFNRMNVLERQQEQLQQPPLPQLPMDYFSSDAFSPPVQGQQDFTNDENNGGGLFTQAMKPDPGLDTNFDNPVKDGSSFDVIGNVTGFEMNYAVSRTISCPPAIAAAMAEAAIAASKAKETVLPERLSSSSGRDSFKKRKSDKNHNSKVYSISSLIY